MAERYDAAIIGAGADGLAAAALLGRAGLRAVVLERQPHPGGLLATRQFHPGFFAAPFADDVAPIDDGLFWSLDLARHGAWATPPAPAMAVWPDKRAIAVPLRELDAAVGARRAAALARARLPAPPPSSRWNPFAKEARADWPAESWNHRALADLLSEFAPSEEQAALAAAGALEGRAADPLAAGTALHLLVRPAGGVWRGALGGLGTAFAAAAREAGAEIACGLEVSDIRCHKGRVAGVGHADGSEVAARAVISTLDLKRTFLSMFPWNELPKPAIGRIAHFRTAGSTARLLLALGERPERLPRGPVHVTPDIRGLVEAHAAWRGGVLAERLPATLRVCSASDPALAPIGAATLTATIGCVPFTPFDGAWTREKRDLLARRVFAAIEEVLPGVQKSVLGFELLVPPDLEEALSATAGDPLGGEIAPDQMFAFRPGFERGCPYTPVDGLYLAGPSSAAGPLATGSAGAIAAAALIADLRAGRLA
ncbi:MAG: FAD-dependent oxidoreductase [Rhizomicrobium sp.]